MLLCLNPEMQWPTLSAWGQMVQQSAGVLPEGAGGAFLLLLQLFLLNGSVGCCGGTLAPLTPLELPVSLPSPGSVPAVGTSPSAWGDLLLSLFLPGFDESTVESEELFYRPAYKMYPRIDVSMYLRESS